MSLGQDQVLDQVCDLSGTHAMGVSILPRAAGQTQPPHLRRTNGLMMLLTQEA
jgi:hypothetical protein